MFNREKFFEYVINLYLNQSNRFTQGQVYRILYELHKHGMLFHLDDNPSDVGHYAPPEHGQWVNLFTNREAAILRTVQPAFFGIDVLPDYEGCPHRICCEVSNFSSENLRTLPFWGFSFDDEPDNSFKGFTSPQRWNGWGCPLLRYEDMKRLLETGGYTFVVTYNRQASLLPQYAVFLISGIDGEIYPPGEEIIINPERVMNTNEDIAIVYSTDQLGLCFNVDDCLEHNPHDWEGYL